MSGARRAEVMGDGAFRWRRDPTRDARALLEALRAHPGVVDAVVTEEHALVTFDPAREPPREPWRLEDTVGEEGTAADTREHVVGAVYDGPDLDEVATRAGVSREEIARVHAAGVYVVRSIGFLPGFAYLGPVHALLAIPRRSTPRARVEAGSIGVAAGYTGIYPVASPGGWNLIGRAVDFAAFDVKTGARLGLGDRVRFVRAPR